MTGRLAFGIVLVVVSAAQPKPLTHRLLILCEGDSCEFRRVLTIQMAGRDNLRVAISADAIAPSAIGDLSEVRLTEVTELYRNPASGSVEIPGGLSRPSLALPGRLSGNQPVTPAASWKGQLLTFVDAAAPKVKVTASVDRLAYFIATTDVEASISSLLTRWVDSAEADPRRFALIKGAFKFTTGPAAARWREALSARTLADLKRFEGEEGDPTTLVIALENSVRLRAAAMEAGATGPDAPVYDRVAAAHDLFRRRVAIAEGLRKSQLWDEYLAKLDQIGMPKWSLVEALPRIRDAQHQASSAHQELHTAYLAGGSLDRAFDEAALAARTSCDDSVREAFFAARVEFVHRNRIAAAPEYSGPSRTYLEQILRELEVLDPNLEQQIFRRIRDAEARDPDYLPIQLKKAEFLDKLGRYVEALEVLWRIERTTRLDARQVDVALGLDGRIRNSLAAALEQASTEVEKHRSAMDFGKVLEAARKGLTADPTQPSLLYWAAVSAAILKQTDLAKTFIQSYFKRANIACAPQDSANNQPQQMLELYRWVSTAAQGTAARDNGVPNWVSGAKYIPGDVFYDPVSLSFQQPVSRIAAENRMTVFKREDRSLMVSEISVTRTDARQGSPTVTAYVEEFIAEPTYNPKTLTMIEVGPKANSTGVRTKHALTYLNSPTIDVELVFRVTGKRIARGWAGNPYFHPFIWRGFYIFDLTYDELGRVKTATPVAETAGTLRDDHSEPLEFTWEGGSNRLLAITGKRSGYVRQLHYDGRGRLTKELATFAKKRGEITYEYFQDTPFLVSAKSYDEFYDFRLANTTFDARQNVR